MSLIASVIEMRDVMRRTVVTDTHTLTPEFVIISSNKFVLRLAVSHYRLEVKY
jgi:hypothetical protein